MRNLKLLKSLRSTELRRPGVPQGLSVRSEAGSFLLVSGFCIIEFDPRTGEVVREVSLTTDSYLPEDGSGKLVGIQDLPDQESVCVATGSGDVLLFDLTTNQVECVGSVDSGLTSMSWSPDQELVALTTGQGTIITMTKDFEPITEVSMHQDGFGEGRFITVGWGKKETQFHGTEGKQAAQKETPEVQPAVASDDRKPRLTWRGDGQLFAVSSVCPRSGARKVRVWNRECVLQATSETLNGLEHPLCWKPSGSLIASTQRHLNKHSVVFMERNGLVHGDFTLPFSKDQAMVKELLWNCDSTVLAVWLEDRTHTYIQLWTVGNYHWYLKQSLHFGTDQQRAPACVTWDPELALRLHTVSRGWTTHTYDWAWCTDRSPGLDATDNASVAVIDGDKVLVTAFRQTVVPPPMCSFELQLPVPVNLVSFLCQPQRTNELAVLTTEQNIALYGPGSGGPTDKLTGGLHTVVPPLELKSTYSVSLERQDPLGLRLLLWLREDTFLGVVCGEMPSTSTLLVLCPSPDHNSQHALQIRSTVDVNGEVVSMVHSAQSGSVALQLHDGQNRKFLWDCPQPSVVEWQDATGRRLDFPTRCVQTSHCTVSGQEYLLGLTDTSHLYVGDTQVASNVSSFFVHTDFLLLTTHSHICRCLKLSTLNVKGLKEVLAVGLEGGENDETMRRVERGSRLVTMVPMDTRLVLQMPRGNLETIHHRALVLVQLRKGLDSSKFKEAFESMRKLRINLNLIYDHNPKLFLENVETFITQINSINHINLFLTELKEEDTSCTMYPCTKDLAMPPAPHAMGKKVDVVCDALRTAMERMDPDKFCLPILTAHVKKSTPELDIALQKVHELRVTPRVSSEAVTAEEALSYLLFLVNVNELYDHSLGTYDFDLVSMVAQRSQKDPKEYLPFLNQLRSLEPNYQRFTIDKHLKRYSKALQHISQCGEEHFDEALTLVKEHNLYSQALGLYRTDSPQYKALSCVYAEHLVEQQEAEQAGLLLWRCGETSGALQAFVGGAVWRKALCVAQQIPLTSDQLSLLARDLAEKLMELRRYTEAAVLLEQYAKDCEEAISALITGAVWEEALRLSYMYDRQDIIETNLKPAILDVYGNQMVFLETQRALFCRHQARLALVRELKEKARLEQPEDDLADCGPEVELYSEASSVMTGSRAVSTFSHSNSRISSRSSKNRRKAERKKLSLKEGSPLEDTALQHALAELVHSVDKMRDEVQSLLKVLVLFHFDGQATKLQLAYGEALQMMEAAIPEVWQEGLSQNQPPVTGPNSTANSIMTSFQQQRPVSLQLDGASLPPPKIRTGVKWKLCILK